MQDDIKRNENKHEEQKGDIPCSSPEKEILQKESRLYTDCEISMESEIKEISVDDKCLQDADKSCESVTSVEQQERSSSSGFMKYTLDEGCCDDKDFGEKCYSEVVSEKTNNEENDSDREDTDTKDIERSTQRSKEEAAEKTLINNSENELLENTSKITYRERGEIKEKAIISESTNKSLGDNLSWD